MSDDLRKLIEAVESGTAVPWRQAIIPLGSMDNALDFAEAQGGSLECALALMETLLPGWIWGRGANGVMWVHPPEDTLGLQNLQIERELTLARGLLLATLLATLLAYRSTLEASHE